MSDLPLLGYALLGLIDQKPSSGYDLRKVFAETAMGNYSSSPGAIYPALERLEAQRLVRGVVAKSAGLRRRRLYYLTLRGRAELKKWLARPLEQIDLMRGAGEAMLRFAFMDRALGATYTRVFLRNFRDALKAYIAGLDSYLAQNATRMPFSGRLALDCGIRGYRSMYDWTAYALRAYRQQETKPHSAVRKSKPGDSR
jgi:DNA-binding PadR family transcriptional regulator